MNAGEKFGERSAYVEDFARNDGMSELLDIAKSRITEIAEQVEKILQIEGENRFPKAGIETLMSLLVGEIEGLRMVPCVFDERAYQVCRLHEDDRVLSLSYVMKPDGGHLRWIRKIENPRNG